MATTTSTTSTKVLKSDKIARAIVSIYHFGQRSEGYYKSKAETKRDSLAKAMSVAKKKAAVRKYINGLVKSDILLLDDFADSYVDAEIATACSAAGVDVPTVDADWVAFLTTKTLLSTSTSDATGVTLAKGIINTHMSSINAKFDALPKKKMKSTSITVSS